jgi:hypothetical protein
MDHGSAVYASKMRQDCRRPTLLCVGTFAAGLTGEFVLDHHLVILSIPWSRGPRLLVANGTETIRPWPGFAVCLMA